MKIVHLCLSCFYIDNYSYQENILPKYHVKMGYDVSVIASSFSFDEYGRGCNLSVPSERMDSCGYKVIRIEYKKPIKLYKILRRYLNLYNTLVSEKPDIIFSHGISMSEIDTLVKFKKKYPHVKLYGDNHSDYFNSATNFWSKNILHKIVWKYYVKKIEPYLIKCYGVTPMRCRFLKEMYNLKPSIIEYLPMGIDDEAIPVNRDHVRKSVRQELGILNDDFLIITGGKIDQRKNTHVLLEALRRLNKPNLHLVICGVLSPNMEYLKESFNNNIHYLGWCNSERVMEIMVASDLACFPGTHSTLWEQSVGTGMPAIFKHWNEMTHVNVNGNCIFVSGDDPNELQEVIGQMLVKNIYATLKRKAEIAARSFLYSDIAKKSIEVSYNENISGI